MDILFVDDDRGLLDQAKVFLERLDGDIEVYKSTSAKRALKKLDEKNFDAVVSDYQMPGIDGLEFLNKIREERKENIPFIMFTGKGREEVAMDALNMGANRYLQKGGDPRDQYDFLSKAIKQEVINHHTKEKLELNKMTVENASIAIYWVNPKGKFVYANKTARERLGYSLEEFTDMYIWDVDPNFIPEQREDYWKRLKREGSVFLEAKGRKKEGEVIPLEVSSNYIKFGNKEMEYVFVHDVSDRKRREKKVKDLYRATTELMKCTSKKEAYECVVNIAEDILDFHSGSVLTVDDDVFRIEATIADNLEKETVLPKNGIRWLTFRDKESYLIDDIGEWSEAKPSQEEFISALSVPIGEIGVLQALSVERSHFDEFDLEMAKILASYLNEVIVKIESEKERSILLDSSPNLIVYRDFDNNILWANKKAEEVTGLDSGELEGRKCYEVWNDRHKPCEDCPVEDSLKEEKVEKKEIKREDGTWWELTCNPVKSEGEIEGALEIISEITDRKRRERRIKEMNSFQQAIIKNANVCINVVDENGKILEWNKGAEEISGYPREEVMGNDKIWGWLYPDEDYREEIFRESKRVIDEDSPKVNFDTVIKTKEGDRRIISWNSKKVEEDGSYIAVSVGKDITEQREAREEIEREKNRYETLFESNPDAIAEADDKCKIVRVNSQFEELFGYEEEDIIGVHINDLIIPEEKMDEAEELDVRVREEGYFDYETVRSDKKGDRIPVSITGKSIEYDGKKHSIDVYRDISDKKEAERKVQESKDKMEKLHRASAELERCKSEDEIYSHALKSAKEILDFDICGFAGVEDDKFVVKKTTSGVPDGEFVGRRIEDGGIDKKTYLEQEPYLIEDIGEEEDTKPVNDDYNSALSVPIGEYGIFQAVSKESEHFDEEEVKLTELLMDHVREALERVEMEEKYRIVTEGSSSGIYVFQDWDFKFVNESLVEMSGYSREEFENIDYFELVHPYYREDVKEWTKQALKGEVEDLPNLHDLKVMRKDGKSIWIRLTPSLAEYEGKPAIIGNVTDITEHKKLEEREEFLHSLLRHDVKNKNQIVLGYLELMSEYDVPEEVDMFIDKAKKATKDGNEIIEKVRDLRKIESKEEIDEISISTIFNGVIAEHEDQLKEKGIEFDVEDCDQVVKGGPLLKELFSNLVENSIRHSGCGLIKISGDLDEDECVITVEDDGEGMEDDVKENIFDKGFRSGENSGSGLGLYMVKEIAESYGGSVEVGDSELGGAKFVVRLKMI